MVNLLLSVLVSLAQAQSPGPTEKVISVDDYSQCGIITKIQPNKLPNPACFQAVDNAVIDADGSLLRRQGYAPYNATASTGTQAFRYLGSFTDTNGATYLIGQTSATMVQSQGNGVWTSIPGLNGGLSTTANMSCVQCIGNFYCTDGVDTVFSLGVNASTNPISAAPLGKYIGCFRNRVVISGVPGNQTNVYLSGQVNGADWTVPAVQLTTSPVILNISGANDGLPVTCLLGEFQNSFFVGRDYDLWALSGYDTRDFTLRKFDGQIGCMDNHSEETVNNTLMWLSHRGVEQMNGPTIQWASYPIDPTLKTIIQAAGNSQSATVNGNNFSQGNLTVSGPSQLSTTIAAGNLSISTWGVTTAGVGADWAMVDVDTTYLVSAMVSNTDGSTLDSLWTVQKGTISIVNHQMVGEDTGPDVLSTPITNSSGTWSFVFNSTENGSAATLEFWYAAVSTATDGSSTGAFDVRIFGPGNTNAVDLIYVNSNLAAPANIQTLGTYNAKNYYDGNNHIFRVHRSTGGFQEVVADNVVIISSQSTLAVTSPVKTNVKWDALGGGIYLSKVKFPNFYPTQESTVYNLGFSTPVWGNYLVTLASAATSPVTFNTYFATSTNGPFTAGVAQTPGSILSPSVSTDTVLRNQIVMAVPTSSATISSVTSLSLSAAATGYYITPCVVVSSPSSWGQLTVNAVTNGGIFTFWMSTGATCANATSPNATWNLQTANSIITVTTTTTDVAVRVLFNVDVGTEAPVLNNLVVNWNAGASRPPVASAQYLNRYYLFYTTSQAVGAANDHAVVYDQNGHWQLYDDIPAGSATLFQNLLYLGDSNATGTVYLFDTGQADNGKNYTFSFTTPDLDGGDPLSPKQWSRAYLVLGSPNTITQNTCLSCTYTLDGSTETFTLGSACLSDSPTQSGYFVEKLPFPVGQPTTSKWVNLSCSNVGANGPIRVFALRLVYTGTAWP